MNHLNFLQQWDSKTKRAEISLQFVTSIAVIDHGKFIICHIFN